MSKVTKILTAFEKTIKKLEKVSNECTEKIVKNTDQIAHLNGENAVLTREADRADSVASKLRDLVA